MSLVTIECKSDNVDGVDIIENQEMLFCDKIIRWRQLKAASSLLKLKVKKAKQAMHSGPMCPLKRVGLRNLRIF